MSKAKLMTQKYNNYTLIGPYFKHKANVEFEEKQIPKQYKKAFKKTEKLGIKLHYGTWLIQGEPNVILIDFQNYKPNLDEIKHDLWKQYNIDSLHAGSDFNNPVRFCEATATLIKNLKNKLNKNTVIHAHEWMSGFTILRLPKTYSTVFTTHATMLGRTYSARKRYLYENLQNINPEEEAKQLGITEKHLTEKACAHNATTFTTVSKTTGKEATKLLGKKPDVLVLNGVDSKNFPSIENTSIMHVDNRKVLREFQAYHFYPYYTFNLKNNLAYIFAGRYEYENKGLDIYVKALQKLNQYLKKQDNDRTITAFFFLAIQNKGVKKEILQNKNSYRHIKHYVERQSKTIQEDIINEFIEKGKDFNKHVFKKEFVQGLKKDVLTFKQEGQPPLNTHHMYNEETDPLLHALKKANLTNKREDKVKIVVYPQYLDGNDGLLNRDYFETLSAGHLGVFPSYYEPWGYTPLESAALGVPSVTTDLAGFGKFIEKETKKPPIGIHVVQREGKKEQEQINNLFSVLKEVSQTDHSERVQKKLRAKQLSQLADWQHLINNYVKAHNHAINKK